jgi:hypothetical protein
VEELTRMILNEVDGYRGIVFEESHIQKQEAAPNWLSVVPLYFKIPMLQLFFVFIFYIWSKGKRLGLAKVDEEEVERKQDEFFWAASNYYEHTKCYDKMLFANLRKLKQLLPRDDKRALQVLEKTGIKKGSELLVCCKSKWHEVEELSEKQIIEQTRVVQVAIKKLEEMRRKNA